MKHLILILITAGIARADSLLTTNPETPAEATARLVRMAPQRMADVILRQLEDETRRLWDSPDPQAVLDIIGTRGAELFTINGQFGGLVATILTQQGDAERLARLAAIQSRIKPHTVNPDGTVTINPEPEPTPEP